MLDSDGTLGFNLVLRLQTGATLAVGCVWTRVDVVDLLTPFNGQAVYVRVADNAFASPRQWSLVCSTHNGSSDT